MAGRQGAQRLLPLLGRAFSTARYAAKAGEEVLPISNAHKLADSVIQVPALDLRQARLCAARSRALK